MTDTVEISEVSDDNLLLLVNRVQDVMFITSPKIRDIRKSQNLCPWLLAIAHLCCNKTKLICGIYSTGIIWVP